MQPEYQRRIIDAQYGELLTYSIQEGWNDCTFGRDDYLIYMELTVPDPGAFRYLVKIDMERYPVDPYWIGFINAELPRERWRSVSDSDPRFWPWSPMPGLHGSFNLIFPGPIRTFWCRECNSPFFLYHGLEYGWNPARWRLRRVVSHLRRAILEAESPARWRPLERADLLLNATRNGVPLPSDAGIGNK